MFILFLLCAAGGAFWLMTDPEVRPVVISVYEPPIIHPQEATHDLGNIPTDSKAEHTFYVYNTGGKKLLIDRVDTTCGCTVAEISKKQVSPGEFTRIKVTLDTSIKLGKVKKKITVISNDPKQPALKLFLTGNVLPQMKGHERIAVKDPLVLFKGECATCHVMKGKGKSGKALFQADCAMCHGLNAQGGVAPSLLEKDYSEGPALTHIRTVIENGASHNPEMPPFAQAKGGPLNPEEIDSLVVFLQFQSEQAKQGLLDKEPGEDEE